MTGRPAQDILHDNVMRYRFGVVVGIALIATFGAFLLGLRLGQPGYESVAIRSRNEDLGSMRLGALCMFQCKPEELPYGWVACVGQEVESSNYPELYALWKKTVEESAPRFLLPDLRRLVVLRGESFSPRWMLEILNMKLCHRGVGLRPTPDAIEHISMGIVGDLVIAIKCRDEPK